MRKNIRIISTGIFTFFFGIVMVSALSFSGCKSSESVKISHDGDFEPIGSVYANRVKNGDAYLFGLGHESSDSKNRYGSIYTTENGDFAYCLQSNKNFKTGNYCQVGDFDAGECTKSNTSLNCGLVYIALRATEEGLDYGVTQTALRMWAAGNGMPDVDKGTKSEYNFYEKSYKKAIDTEDYSTNGIACDGSNLPGIICTGVSEQYIQALELVKETKEGQTINGDEQVGEPQIITKVLDETVGYIDTSIPGDVDPENVSIELNGDDLDVGCTKKGEKQICRGEIKEDICESSTPPTTAEIVLKIKHYSGSGTIKEYQYSGGGDYQTMLVIEGQRDSEESEERTSTYTEGKKVSVSCGACKASDKVCPANVKEPEIPSNCTGYDSYNEGYKNDPYMNCILNACPVNKNYFRQTQYEPDDGATCKIYCREEIQFYMANKKKVYAGMQFKYKIQESLINDRKLENVLSADTDLTSVVLQERECTSEIDFSGWLKRYSDNVKKLVAAWNNWKKYEVLLFDVENNNNDENSNIVTMSYCKLVGQSPKCKIQGMQHHTTGNTVTGYSCPTKYTSEYCNNDCNMLNENAFYYKSKTGKDSILSSELDCEKNSTLISNKGRYGGTIKTVYVYSWPKERVNNGATEKYNKADLTNQTFTNGKFGITTNPNATASYDSKDNLPVDDSYTKNELNPSVCSTESYSIPVFPTKKNPNPDPKTHCSYDCSATCQDCSLVANSDGENGNPGKVKELHEKYKNEYMVQKTELAKMLYILQSCNFYGAGDKIIDNGHYGGYGGKDVLVAKSEILKDAACENDSCVDLLVDYVDKKYGQTVKVGKVTGDVTTDEQKQNKYCTGNKCYEYKSEEEEYVETNTSTHQQSINEFKCEENKKNGTCKTPSFSVPKNTHVTFTTVTEVDFWQDQKYTTTSYTGKVEVKDDQGSSNGNKQDLAPYVYPVSLDAISGGKTGDYDIVQHFSNIGQGRYKVKDFDFTCQYEVYNTTTLYDCSEGDASCSDPCYTVEGSVPDMQCLDWIAQTDTKSYGFVYRNVDLSNMFPTTDRGIGTNWSKETDLIQKIQANATDIFDESNLEYKFVLTTDDINRIRREYNAKKSSNGYLNNTLVNCKPGEDGLGFYNCKSTFFMEANITNVK